MWRHGVWRQLAVLYATVLKRGVEAVEGCSVRQPRAGRKLHRQPATVRQDIGGCGSSELAVLERRAEPVLAFRVALAFTGLRRFIHVAPPRVLGLRQARLRRLPQRDSGCPNNDDEDENGC